MRRDMGRVWRKAAYRRALEQAGYQPQSIEVMLRRDARWLECGADIKQAKRRPR